MGFNSIMKREMGHNLSFSLQFIFFILRTCDYPNGPNSTPDCTCQCNVRIQTISGEQNKLTKNNKVRAKIEFIQKLFQLCFIYLFLRLIEKLGTIAE